MKKMIVCLLMLLMSCATVAPAETVVESVAIPDFVLSENVYMTLDEMGLPLDEVLAGVPKTINMTCRDGMLTVFLDGVDDMACTSLSDGGYYAMTNGGNGMWTAYVTDTEEQFATNGFECRAYNSFEGWSIMYINGAWEQLDFFTAQKNLCITEDRVSRCMPGYDAVVYSYYDAATGLLLRQHVVDSFTGSYAVYSPSGELNGFYPVTEKDQYIYTEDGWTCELEATGEVIDPSDPPEGYEEVTLSWVLAWFPSQLDYVQPTPAPIFTPAPTPTQETVVTPEPTVPVTPAPLSIAIPAEPAVLPDSIAAFGFDRTELDGHWPNSDGVVWDNDMPMVPDNGYSKVQISDGWDLDYYDMVKENGYWVVADGTPAYEPYSEGYGVIITLGNVAWKFIDGEMAYAILDDYLRCYPSGSCYMDLIKEDGQICGIYDANGDLTTAEYFPHWLEWQTFLYFKADGSIDYLMATERWVTVYYWYPDQGWCVGNWSDNEPCEAPEIFADLDEKWCYAVRDRLNYGEGGAPEVTVPDSYINVLPADLAVIEADAFLNAALTDCDIPSGVTTIGSGAFKGCTELTFVRIPVTVTDIAADAFNGCDKLVIVCEKGSAAAAFAQTYGLTCIME